jgi:hypothetical protein
VNIVTSTSYVIAVGTVLFNEHLPTSPGPLALRIAGFAGVVAGLVALAATGDKNDPTLASTVGEGEVLTSGVGSDQLKSSL